MPAITVLYFAQAQDRCGYPMEIVDFPAMTTTSTVRDLLTKRHAALAELIPHCRLALNHAFIEGALTLTDGDELAVIPPVSGG